ncbi:MULTISPECIES: dethiobiotin synthase [Nitrincola]|uniref:ATP-dependent dethiobiotin synthetase BioD n=1 Tax=Nitrincola nitratireducens TaxID=1229521 RepID=W9UWL4_9GAMM|nr:MULTISPECIES: dethiobiotin synthase [Nitrincola]EXJ11633.1 ATP-dependent dethiobiotin synthetase BioD 1 [Nitrincola nitratireducens]
MKQHFFITGTDTGVGKTLVSTALLTLFNQQGYATIGLKPVAAGCEMTPEGLRNDDALQLQNAASVELDYDLVNPVALAQPIAPHLAAGFKMLSAERIAAFCRGAMLHDANIYIIEGAGGWRVPLNRRETMADIPKLLEIPVILVVGMKLGCLNHALLTAESIRRDGLQLAGWVAVETEPSMLVLNENIRSLQERIPAPFLGHIPYMAAPSAEAAAACLSIECLEVV